MLSYLSRAIVLAIGLVASQQASAYIECQKTPLKVYVDSGTLWITWVNGGAATVSLGDPAAKSYLAFTSTAMVTGHDLIARYADGQNCGGTNALIGLWMI